MSFVVLICILLFFLYLFSCVCLCLFCCRCCRVWGGRGPLRQVFLGLTVQFAVIWESVSDNVFSPMGPRKMMGSCSARQRCGISLRIFLEGSMGVNSFVENQCFKKQNVSRHYISNLNMSIGLEDHFCVNVRPGSNGTIPGPQNHNEKHNKSTHITLSVGGMRRQPVKMRRGKALSALTACQTTAPVARSPA